MKKVASKLILAALILTGSLILPSQLRSEVAEPFAPTWCQCMDRCPYTFEYCLFLCERYTGC